VRHAWVLELARRRECQEFALRIERESYDNAIGHLIAAQRDGDPGQISVARTVALEAVDAVRAAVAADTGGHPRSRPSKPIVNSQGRRGLYLRRLVRWRAADLGRQ